MMSFFCRLLEVRIDFIYQNSYYKVLFYFFNLLNMIKKFFIISIFSFCSLLLIGCTTNKDDEFENKKKCADAVSKRAKEVYKENSPSIKEIVYSKKNNSCLIFYRDVDDAILKDIFSNKVICWGPQYYGDRSNKNLETLKYLLDQDSEFDKCLKENR